MSGVGGRPASFGRGRAEDVVAEPDAVAEPVPAVQVPGGLRVVDGRLVLEVDVALIVAQDVMQGLYDQVREVVALAVVDGFAAATGGGERDADEVLGGPDAGEQP